MMTDILDPLVFWVYGAHINRRTLDKADRAGLVIEHVEARWNGMVQCIVAQPKGGRVTMSEHERAGTLQEQGKPSHREEGETKRVQRIYDRNASRYDTVIRIMERLLVGDGRAWACGQAHGDVLEIAIGTGRNLPFYPENVRVTGIDVSLAMLARARERAAALGRDADLRVGNAQALEFPNDRFDTVVCTLGLCTIPDDRQAIAEMKRVLRPGGTLLLLEHVRSPVLPVRLVQRLLAPLFLRCEGDHLLREPLTGVRAEGLAVERLERSKFGIMERLIARKAEGA